jgi:hypothetical protein
MGEIAKHQLLCRQINIVVKINWFLHKEKYFNQNYNVDKNILAQLVQKIL